MSHWFLSQPHKFASVILKKKETPLSRCVNDSEEETVVLDAGCYWFWRRRRVLSVFCSFCFRRSSSSVLGDNLINKATNGIKCLSFCDFSILKMAHISWPWLKINYDSTHLPRTSPCLWSPMPTFVNWSFAWGNLLDHETASPHHFKRETVSNHVKEDSWKAKTVSCMPHFRVISSRHLKFSVEIK